MDPQVDEPGFGQALQDAMAQRRISNQTLAAEIDVDPAQVSRWRNGRQLPRPEHVAAIERALHVDLTSALAASGPDHELYVSSPITGLDEAKVLAHHDEVEKIVEAAKVSVPKTYWPGAKIHSHDDLEAPWLATERNMNALVTCDAFLYVQLDELTSPSSALVELGIALGRRIKVTIILKEGVRVPFMFRNFESVAQRIKFLPDARIMLIREVEEAVRLFRVNGRQLLGLSR